MKLVTFVFATALAIGTHAHAQYGDVRLERIYPGDTVYTASGSQGTVNGIFSDRDVSVKINYANYTYQRSDIAGGGCSDGACHTDSVVTRSGSAGTVNGVFPSGALSVKINYANYKYERNDIAIKGCIRNICSEQSVTTRSGSSGTVNGFFPNGDVSVKINYANYTYRLSDIAGEQTRPPRRDRRNPDSVNRTPLTGETIFTTSGSTGTVNGIFNGNSVSVKINYANYTYARDQIAVTGCFGNLCSDDRVTTRSGSSGTINGFFPNGDVSVKINYANYKFSYNDLAASY